MSDEAILAAADRPALSMAAGKTAKKGFGLTTRVLVLFAVFVLFAEITVFVPAIAFTRMNWLSNRLSAAYIAALVLEATPDGMIPETLLRDLMASVQAHTIVMKIHNARRMLAVTDMPPMVDDRFDLRNPSIWQSFQASMACLFSTKSRVLQVQGLAPMGGDFIEITMDEAPLKAVLQDYALRILGISFAISGIFAALAVWGLNIAVLRPVRRLTNSLMEFARQPEDRTRIIKPSSSDHEIGAAERALAAMQDALSSELAQKKHLAALGLGVAKINHDLRNMLAPAQLLSDRLAGVPDPLVQKLAPRLVSTLGRAIDFAETILAYGRTKDTPPLCTQINLHDAVTEVFETLAPACRDKIICKATIPSGMMVKADSEQLFRILLNLCRNAAQALEAMDAPEGFQRQIDVHAAQTPAMTIIDVRDNGPGIPPKARERLFEAFQGTTRPGGSGLGLAIAADLVKGHGGTLELVEQSAHENSSGAHLRIYLPH